MIPADSSLNDKFYFIFRSDLSIENFEIWIRQNIKLRPDDIYKITQC